MAICQICGKEFVKVGSEECCSTPCGWERLRRLEQARMNKLPQKEQECPWCKCKFMPSYNGQKFCSPSCSDDYRDAFRDVQLIYKSKVTKEIEYAKINPKEPTKDIFRKHGI